MSKKKGFKPHVDGRGYVEIPMSPGALEAWADQMRAFAEKFGREPGPGDPVIFDPDCDNPTPMSEKKFEELAVDALSRAGAPPEIIYAFSKTGMLVTPMNVLLWSAADLKEWDDAVEEYFRQRKSPQ